MLCPGEALSCKLRVCAKSNNLATEPEVTRRSVQACFLAATRLVSPNSPPGLGASKPWFPDSPLNALSAPVEVSGGFRRQVYYAINDSSFSVHIIPICHQSRQKIYHFGLFRLEGREREKKGVGGRISGETLVAQNIRGRQMGIGLTG